VSRHRDDDDRERAEPAWCPVCNAMVQPRRIDFGIGPWEMGSQRGWHHDYAIACPDCESTKLDEHAPEDLP